MPNGNGTVVFLGPTLPHSEAARILPGATYLPPARQGDVLSALRNLQPETIALIDGEFRQALSVWHKEILFALSNGVRVLGSSSMGALRAAECAAFGMEGVGRVYRMYAAGEIADDDEVALVHADVDDDWQPLTEPMVNIRVTIEAAVDRRVLDRTFAAELTAVAKGLHFGRRTWPEIFDTTSAVGLAEPGIQAATAFVSTQAIDIKRHDAEELLTGIAVSRHRPEGDIVDWEFEQTYLFETMRMLDERVQREAGLVSRSAIARRALLRDTSASRLLERSLNRACVEMLATYLDIDPSNEAVRQEIMRFRTRHRLTTEADLDALLETIDLDSEAFRDLMHSEARVRAAHQALRIRMPKGTLQDAVVNQLRLDGTYAPIADAAAEAAATADRVGAYAAAAGELHAGATALEALRRYHRHTHWRPDLPLDAWASEAGFHSLDDLLLEMLAALVVDAG